MGNPDTTYHCDEGDTSYRLRPNPDAPPGTGFDHGAVMEWSDGDGWKGHFFICPKSLEAMGIALIKAAKDNVNETYKIHVHRTDMEEYMRRQK